MLASQLHFSTLYRYSHATPPPHPRFVRPRFFPNASNDLLLPSFERHCKPSFTRSGSLLGSRPLARIRARAGKLVSSFRVRRGRKRDFSRSSMILRKSATTRSFPSPRSNLNHFLIFVSVGLFASTFSRGETISLRNHCRPRVDLRYNRN